MAKKQTVEKSSPAAGMRPPIVAVVGHIDHGKSTLLDYIRNTSITEKEAGGITQHLSAYEATHTTSSGEVRQITFLDTPGHEAFAAMRSRGLAVADVAILVVSSEEGVKPQTMEAITLIREAHIPYLVALTKIDRPASNIERAKASLIENGVYLEGLGGDIPCVGVSGKTGEGIPELLDLILLAADLQGLSADIEAPGEGVVIEAHVEPKRGSSATLIVKNGTLKSGQYVVAGSSFAPVRIMENFLGKAVREALPGTPIRIVGFSSVPQIGTLFMSVENKKDAERMASEAAEQERAEVNAARTVQTSIVSEEAPEPPMVLPLIIKTDVAGTGDAVIHEIEKIPHAEGMELKVIGKGVGSISETDIRLAAGSEVSGIVIGFNVKIDPSAQGVAEREEVTVATFDLIYKLAEWLGEEVEKRRPRQHSEEKTGTARVLKLFNHGKNAIVLGGRVEEGTLNQGAEVRITRRDLALGLGSIESLQSQKKAVKKVEQGSEFGALIKTDVAIAANDRLEAFQIVLK